MISIDLKSLELNVKHLASDGRKLIAVVKNNAYGCGAIEISKKLIECGISYLLVNDYNELRDLLKNNINANIIIHNSICENDFPLLNNNNIIVTINSVDDVLTLKKSAVNKIKVQIQVNIKMNRLGIKGKDEFDKVLKLLIEDDKFIINGIYTHFTDSDAYDQLDEFKKYVSKYDFQMVHCAASPTYQNIKYGNYIRIGLDLYNINQVITIKSKPISIRKLNRGDNLGYDCLYQANKDELIAIIPIGYGNGYIRKYEGFKVYGNGKFYQVVGRICMNHFFVLVDEIVTKDTVFELTSPNLPVDKLVEYTGLGKSETYTLFKFREVEYLR